jgi:hypothetical protein
MSKTEHPMIDDAALEAFFMAGRAEAQAPSQGLMARVMADADAEILARAARPRPARVRPGLIAAVIGALGGWPALAGMVTATVAGAWFGFAAPDEVNTLAGGLLWSTEASTAAGYDLEDIVPGGTGFGAILEEG